MGFLRSFQVRVRDFFYYVANIRSTQYNGFNNHYIIRKQVSTIDEKLITQYRLENPNELTEEALLKIERELTEPKDGTISDELLDFKLWCGGHMSRQEAFAEYLLQYLPPEKSCRILEVGAGRTAKLSRLLAQKGYRMTCMDPELDREFNGKIRGDDIRVVRQPFDFRQVDLSGYDWVVAQEPCEATEHIVRACLAQHKPFVVALCGTPHRLLSGEMPEDIWAWYGYLANLDREHLKLELFKLYEMARAVVIRSVFE